MREQVGLRWWRYPIVGPTIWWHFVFTTSCDEADRMVDAVATSLKEVRLAHNELRTENITTQAQPSKTVTTQHGLEMEILDATKAHKWYGS